MSIKLKGSSDGSVSFDAPADTSPSGSDITLTLPTSAGSADQFLKNSGIAGELEYSSMVETSTGVGIGTSNLNTNTVLSVHKGDSSESQMRFTNSTTGEAGNNGFLVGIDSSEGGRLFVQENNYLRFGTNNTEVARLDSSGRLLLGTTTEGYSVADNITIEDSADGGITIRTGTTNTGSIYFSDATSGGGEYDGYIEYSQNSRFMRFGTAQSERMRITSGGTLLLNGATSNPTGATTSLYTDSANNAAEGITIKSPATSGNRFMIGFYNNANSKVGDIVYNGTSTAYNTTSDYRLKENVVAVTDGITRIKQLNPSRFNFIGNTGTTVDGFLAHEVQSVVSEAVTGDHNGVDDSGNPVYQSIDQSKLVPLLTAALQEAIAKIETLETKVAALEAA